MSQQHTDIPPRSDELQVKEDLPQTDQPAPGQALPTGPFTDFAALGAALRQAREAKGLSQADAARSLKLSQANIASLEAGDMTAFPAPAYARGFLRSYVKFLRIPAEDCEPVFRLFSPAPAPDRPVYAPDRTARPARRTPWAGIVVSLLIACAVGWAVWHFGLIDLIVSEGDSQPKTTAPMQSRQTGDRSEQAKSAETPAQPVVPGLPSGMQTPAQTTPGMPAGAGSVSSVGAPGQSLAADDPVTDRDRLPAVVMPDTPWATLQGNATLAGQAGLAAPEAQVNPNLPATPDTLPGGGSNVVTLVSEGTCWTQVTADAGRPVQRTLQPGETFSVRFEGSLTVRLGNAGAVRIFQNGIEMQDRGRVGQVRTITFPLREGR